MGAAFPRVGSRSAAVSVQSRLRRPFRARVCCRRGPRHGREHLARAQLVHRQLHGQQRRRELDAVGKTSNFLFEERAYTFHPRRLGSVPLPPISHILERAPPQTRPNSVPTSNFAVGVMFLVIRVSKLEREIDCVLGRGLLAPGRTLDDLVGGAEVMCITRATSDMFWAFTGTFSVGAASP